MKYFRFSILLAFMTIVAMTNCKKDPVNRLENRFSVEGASYREGSMPGSSSGSTLDVVGSYTRTVLAGGSSIITINSSVTITEIYIGIPGINGYYVVRPTSTSGNVYTFIILLSQSLNDDFILQISALINGVVSQIEELDLNYREQGTGALQISLSFDQSKDLDLYVKQPDGEIIYYGNYGDSEWGLDLDSNAACSLDHINNENIFYPENMVQTGKYEVWVNMYQNCYPQNAPTNYTVVVTRRGRLVSPLSGFANPAIGQFPTNQPSNSIGSSLSGARKVMEFNATAGLTRSITISATTSPLSESAIKKLELSK